MILTNLLISRMDLALGPLMRSKLAAAGLFVHGEECFNLVTRSPTDCRFLVKRRDAPAATELIEA